MTKTNNILSSDIYADDVYSHSIDFYFYFANM